MNKRDVIKYCLTLPNTFEDYPFPDDNVWWTFPIAEIATCIISIFILKKTYKERIAILEEKTDKNIINNKLIISISREHGTGGKEIARRVVEKLELKFFDNVNY